jgi:beta-lactamase regulating signal transducer with metallopeptidase domain
MYHLNQLQKSCQPVKNIKWLEISKQVSKSLKIKRKITLLQSDQVTMPMTWGFFRPYVLIPSSGERWNIHRKKMVLMHEFEHIYRCDWMIQILSSLAVALHWFNPLSWVVSFMIKLEREKACDDAVLRSGISPTDYATTLLLFAKNKKTSSTMGIACALQLITGNQLQSRIQSILNGGVGRKRISKSLWAVLSLTVILTILPIASAHSPVELIQKLECFPEEEYVASELNIMITPAKLNLSEKGKNLQPALKKDSKKPCRKHKCDKSKKGQPTNPKTTKPVILEA